ncbi:hypothetical protein PQO74_000401 [Campylobacter lari]|uniref:hypothetical protein n=1 Tax=Campylobacter lari TaxID=201 RepID=UPI0012F54EEF|nr:hypothetical protein [Campylobacter lari]EAK0799677.1 hypothetical protein [Campylobacter lari]EIV5071109.1 hypothetical protein [Campylobacter lari]EKL1317282.1 hypothetical protein [Campylobacter lari]MCW0238596.1 hypothetical protein [Campylobacter lari]
MEKIKKILQDFSTKDFNLDYFKKNVLCDSTKFIDFYNNNAQEIIYFAPESLVPNKNKLTAKNYYRGIKKITLEALTNIFNLIDSEDLGNDNKIPLFINTKECKLQLIKSFYDSKIIDFFKQYNYCVYKINYYNNEQYYVLFDLELGIFVKSFTKSGISKSALSLTIDELIYKLDDDFFKDNNLVKDEVINSFAKNKEFYMIAKLYLQNNDCYCPSDFMLFSEKNKAEHVFIQNAILHAKTIGMNIQINNVESANDMWEYYSFEYPEAEYIEMIIPLKVN